MQQGASDSVDFASAAPEEGAKLQMAPLIDLVMLLISFYLFVGQLVAQQKDAEVQLPRLDSRMARSELPAELVINLRADGQITMTGQAVPAASLRPLLSAELSKARQDGQELRVVVRADRRQRFAELDEVLRTCQRAGLPQVIFRAQQEGEP